MKLSVLAQQVGGRLIGNDVEVNAVASVASATPADLIFVDDARKLGAALSSRAAALIAGDFAEAETAKPVVIVKNPRLSFARAAELLRPGAHYPPGVHPTAVVEPAAKVAKSAHIASHAVVETGAVIGERTSIGAGTFVGKGVEIGNDCDLRSNVSVYSGTHIGDRVLVHSGAVLGSDGFGFVRDPQNGRYTKFPQIGRLEIGDDVEIGANCTIDRGALDATVIARGTKLDNLVHVGHNVRIGEDVVIAAQTGISGSVVIEDTVVIGGQVGIGDHMRIEKGAILGSQCGVLTGKPIRGPGVVFWGTPARPLKQHLKELAALARLAKKRE